MEVKRELVDKLSFLARLHFTDSEKQAIQYELQRMLHFVEKLNELDTTGVDPLLHMSNAVNRLRSDVVQGSVSREEGLSSTSQQDGIYFKVPKVIRQ